MKPKSPFASTAIMSVNPCALEHDPANLQASLSILAGESEGAVHELSGAAVVLGRAPEADIVLTQPGISRAHARVLQGPAGFAIEDLGSTNGTFVEGTRVDAITPLRDRDRIQIGGVVLRFALQDRMAHEAERRRYEMSVRDGLTGLYNRRHFDERLAGEFSYAVRHTSDLSVIIVDIDHFKQINDRWGHPAGDEVLRQVAGALSKALRTEDFVARYGGEEFAVVARGIPRSGAVALAERLRQQVAALRLHMERELIPVTISAGVAHNRAGLPISTPEALVSFADEALYAAKHGGRNRVETAGSRGAYRSSSRSSTQLRAEPTAPVGPAAQEKRHRG
ncbi:MAG: GGDEF domain-containing protein [Myxococcales bacterium]